MRRSCLLCVFVALFAPANLSLTLFAQTLTIVAGDGQRAPRRGSVAPGGVAKFDALSVALRDANGKGIANARVTFHCNYGGAMACQLTPGGGENGTLAVNTDGNGVATLNQMGGRSINAYYADGALSMDATYNNLRATFHLAVDPGAGPKFLYFAKVVSGDRQTAMRVGEVPYGGTAHFGPLTIEVDDANGKPASNVRVQYGCRDVKGACNFGRSDYATDGSGRLTLASAEYYYATGWITVQFVGDEVQPVDFHLLVTDPPVQKVTWVQGAKLVAVDGDNQKREREGSSPTGGIAKFSPMSVKLTAPDGSPIANAPIQFACEKPTNWLDPRYDFACQLTASGAENGTMSINTDSNGVATLNRIGGNALEFYYNTGTHTMKASYGDIASTTLHFTVTK